MNSYKLLTGKVRFLVKRPFHIAFLNAIRKRTLGERERSDGNGGSPPYLDRPCPPPLPAEPPTLFPPWKPLPFPIKEPPEPPSPWKLRLLGQFPPWKALSLPLKKPPEPPPPWRFRLLGQFPPPRLLFRAIGSPEVPRKLWKLLARSAPRCRANCSRSRGAGLRRATPGPASLPAPGARFPSNERARSGPPCLGEALVVGDSSF